MVEPVGNPWMAYASKPAISGCGSPPDDDAKVFCNAKDGAAVVMPVIPLCVNLPYEYSGNSVSVSVNGKEVDENQHVHCLYGISWVDVSLSEGANNIELTAEDSDGDESSWQIELNYTPQKKGSHHQLLYGIHNGYVVAVDLDNSTLLGKLKPSAPSAIGPFNVAASSDGARLFVPREDGFDVFATANHTMLFSAGGIKTGGRIAVSPDDLYIYLNQSVMDPFDTQYRISVMDAVTGEKVFSFHGGCPDCRMLVPDEQKNLYVLDPYGGMTVYYSSSLYKESKTILMDDLRDFKLHPPGGQIGVLSSYGDRLEMVDTFSNEVVETYFFEEYSDYESFVFSPDGNIVYLGGYDKLTAFDLISQKLIWGKEDWEYGDKKFLSMGKDGSRIYVVNPDECGADILVFDAEDGEPAGVLTGVPIEGMEISVKK